MSPLADTQLDGIRSTEVSRLPQTTVSKYLENCDFLLTNFGWLFCPF
jgi:hypothetical protein